MSEAKGDGGVDIEGFFPKLCPVAANPVGKSVAGGRRGLKSIL